jgi:dTDP-4-dehydrorhamnose reductase
VKILITGAGVKLGQAPVEALHTQDLIPLSHHVLDVIDGGAARPAIQRPPPM